MVCKHLTHLRELEKENAILKYHLATISYFVNLDNLGIKAIEHKAGQVIINLSNRRGKNPEKWQEYEGKTPQCWKCGIKIKAGHVCVKCAGIDENKGISAEAINTVMGGVMETQKKYVERMKTQEEKEKIEEVKPIEQQNFKQFAEGMNKVECVECKDNISLAECDYDPARNKHTCHSCVKKLKETAEKKKEAETQEKIKELKGGIK